MRSNPSGRASFFPVHMWSDKAWPNGEGVRLEMVHACARTEEDAKELVDEAAATAVLLAAAFGAAPACVCAVYHAGRWIECGEEVDRAPIRIAASAYSRTVPTAAVVVVAAAGLDWPAQRPLRPAAEASAPARRRFGNCGWPSSRCKSIDRSTNRSGRPGCLPLCVHGRIVSHRSVSFARLILCVGGSLCAEQCSISGRRLRTASPAAESSESSTDMKSGHTA